MNTPARAALLAALFISGAGASHAQQSGDYPNRPIRVIVPVGAGAGVDTAARITAAAAEKHLGQSFIIENRPGAGARLGASIVARSAPDGYTLLFTSPGPITVAEHFPQRLEFDPARDFRPVATGLFQPVLLIVRPTLGFNSLGDFVAYATANPGKLNFGIQGIGSEMHLAMERFQRSESMSMTPLPYTTAAQAIQDLLADRLDAMFLVIPPIRDFVQTGKLKALATLNASRLAVFPDVPSVTDLGKPGLVTNIWFGYLAPGKTPDAIVERLAGAFAKLQQDEALAKRVSDIGAELRILGPSAFGELIAQDRAAYGKIVADGKLAQEKPGGQ